MECCFASEERAGGLGGAAAGHFGGVRWIGDGWCEGCGFVLLREGLDVMMGFELELDVCVCVCVDDVVRKK